MVETNTRGQDVLKCSLGALKLQSFVAADRKGDPHVRQGVKHCEEALPKVLAIRHPARMFDEFCTVIMDRQG